MRRLHKLFVALVSFGAVTFTSLYAQSGELVVKVETDSKSFSSLDANAKTYMSSAYNRFLQDILSVPEISVRNSSVDENLQAIQLKSQMDAATGMGSEEAAYATDKGSKATLSLVIKVSKINSSTWQVVCTLSEIETKNLIATIITDKLSLTDVTSDTSIDKFAYNTLLAMQKRGYLKSIPASVVSQLQHLEDSSEAYKRYLQDYTNQIEEMEREKQRLQNSAKTAEEKAEAERSALAIQLKIDMLEKSRQQAEAALRRQQEAEANEAKRRKEMNEMSQQQQDKINQEIQKLEKLRSELRDATVSSMSLKKRIELIESDKSNLAKLNKMLNQNVEKIQSDYDAARDEKISEIMNEPWRKGETDASGNPTELAKSMRQKKASEIRTNYEKLKSDAVSELKKSAQASLTSYEKQINLNLQELAKTTYVFRSIDSSEDYLSLWVDEFDGTSYSWTVHSAFSATDIPKLDASRLSVLPNATISYETMTGGQKPATAASSADDYATYLDLVERADLYFRVSVPYLYSQLAIKIEYNSYYDKYIASPVYFQIYKMENSTKPLAEMKSSDFTIAERKKAEADESARKEAEREAQREKLEEERARREEINRSLAEKKAKLKRQKQQRLEELGRSFYTTGDIIFNQYGCDFGCTAGGTYPLYGGIFVGADLSLTWPCDADTDYGSEYDMGVEGVVTLGSNFLIDDLFSYYVKIGAGGAYSYLPGTGFLGRAAVGVRYAGLLGVEYSLDYVSGGVIADRISCIVSVGY